MFLAGFSADVDEPDAVRATGPFKALAPLVLASGSPRRKELLGSTGVAFEIVVSDVAEPDAEPGEAPRDYALRMARLKARDVAAGRPGAWVLGADTVVAVEGHILGKPVDVSDARRMLAMLSGRTHVVVTGCCLIGPDGRTAWEYAMPSTVTFAALSQEAIAAYAATGEPLDKAGGYAVQGQGAFMIQAIEGSYSNVMGLPLAETVQALSRLGTIISRSS